MLKNLNWVHSSNFTTIATLLSTKLYSQAINLEKSARSNFAPSFERAQMIILNRQM